MLGELGRDGIEDDKDAVDGAAEEVWVLGVGISFEELGEDDAESSPAKLTGIS